MDITDDEDEDITEDEVSGDSDEAHAAEGQEVEDQGASAMMICV